jgi:hypothetical protein
MVTKFPTVIKFPSYKIPNSLKGEHHHYRISCYVLRMRLQSAKWNLPCSMVSFYFSTVNLYDSRVSLNGSR